LFRYQVLRRVLIGGAGLLASAGIALAAVGAAQQAVLDRYARQAKTEDASFAGFSADRGKAFFLAQWSTGHGDTPSCSTCHTTDPRQMGRTRAGKEINPMALSRTPDRFGDVSKTEKWFGRNCDTVIGRACTAREKGDFITFMAGQ
jgi:mono/diheme cytochrome c family protein